MQSEGSRPMNIARPTPTAEAEEPRCATSGGEPRRNGQRHPDSRRRCGAARQVGTSGTADGHGQRRDGAVDPIPEVRPGDARMGRSRPVHPVGRPWLDAAVFASLPFAGSRRSPSRRSATSGNWARRRPAIPNTRSRAASRRRPAPWRRASATPSAWRWPNGCAAPAGERRSSITTPTASSATAA